MMKRIKKA